MTDYIGKPPAVKTIPVTRGTDVSFTLRRKDTDGNPVDWDSDVYVDIDIDRKTPTERVQASVTGSDAHVRIESDMADDLTRISEWRAVRSVPGDPSLERPLVVGGFERFDGRKT